LQSIESLKSIAWSDDHIVLLDQTLLPVEESYLQVRELAILIEAIKKLRVRGAPALGVAGALGVVLIMDQAARSGWSDSMLQAGIDELRHARPTAVNLAWGVDQVRHLVPAGRAAVLAAALEVLEDDCRSNLEMAANGVAELASHFQLTLQSRKLRLLTHCNTGSLATAGIGTALGVIKSAFNAGLVEEVLADESRPLLQGGRLTAFELARAGIPFRIQPDSAAAMAMLNGMVDAAFVGADRIAANGDSANKIGTLSVALAAKAAGIPFYIVAPESTVDRSIESGADIEIELRGDEELTQFNGKQIAPLGTKTFNPAFDVTPAHLIAGVITEKKIYRVSDGERL
jgi:methylthioribose-1-phosphate isomerase